MIKSRVTIVITVLAAALLLSSCASNSKQEDARKKQDADREGTLFTTKGKGYSRTSLEVPPDLLASSGDKVRANAASASDIAAGNAGGEEVLPEIIGAKIESDGGKSWLQIDADAEVVWRKLTEFWAFQEIDLIEYKPQAGLMETDWFAKKGNKAAAQGFTAVAVELFDTLVSRRTALDKFTIRLERNGAGGTRLFATHRAREKIAREIPNSQKDVEFDWVEREQDSEKIAQLLQTIVLLFDVEAEVEADAGDGDDEPA